MKKYHKSKQRQILLDAVRARGDHPSADQIYWDARAKDNRISRGTVYRNLGILAETEEISRVRLPAADRYDFRTDRHYHVSCTGCGKTIDAPLGYRPEYDKQVEEATGFRIDRHRMVFEGLCPECAEKEGESKTRKREDLAMDKKAMHKLSYGLFVVSTAFEGRDNGCIINTAGQVTSEPNRISITVNKANYTEEMIQKSGRFNLSVLSEKAGFDLFERFGFHSGRDRDKFAGFSDYKRSANGLCYITAGTNAYISAAVEQTVDLGSHALFIASVDDMELLSDAPSATYAYYQENIKPKPAKAEASGKTVWRCVVCGYIYEGEELPADYICPLCKHPASDFEKVTR